MNVVFFLEEPSAREMLKGILPRILGEGVRPVFVVFEGKSDLEKQLLGKIKGWLAPDTKFFVIRDKDSADCMKVKSALSKICAEAGRPDTIVRIACHELESWYLGDLPAIELGLEIKGLSKRNGTAKFRNPDSLGNASEELKKLSRGRYQKISGSRAIAPHLSLDSNRSHSFNVLLKSLRNLS